MPLGHNERVHMCGTHMLLARLWSQGQVQMPVGRRQHAARHPVGMLWVTKAGWVGLRRAQAAPAARRSCEPRPSRAAQMRSAFAATMLSATLLCPDGFAGVAREDFATDPLVSRWRVHGDAELF